MSKVIVCDACEATESEIWVDIDGEDFCQNCYTEIETRQISAKDQFIEEQKLGSAIRTNKQ